MAIARIDHFVLTVRSVDETCAFYRKALGLERIDTPGLPTALALDGQKINLHEVGRTFEPKALVPTPGAGDFCLVIDGDIDALAAHLRSIGVGIEVGPVERVGALGAMSSIYFRDPDGNLVEVSRYDDVGDKAGIETPE